MPIFGHWKVTWREKLVTLAAQGKGYEEFFREAAKVVPEEYADHVLLQLPVIYMEVQCEKGLLGDAHDNS